MKFKYELSIRGYIKQQESFEIEFKHAFQYGDDLAKSLKTLVGMANNKGGEIIFGILDSPKIPIGLINDKFANCDPIIVNEYLQKHFSHEINWSTEIIEVDGKSFGRFSVLEAETKPVICKSTHGKTLREGAIYYRYDGKTEEIKYDELEQMLSSEKDKENTFWTNHTQEIEEIEDPRHIHILDSLKGELHTTKGKILIDKTLTNKLNLLKERKCIEVDGKPTLMLTGEITSLFEPALSINERYPYKFKDLKSEFKVNQFQLLAILWKLNVKGNKNYHVSIKTGKDSNTNQYSKDLITQVGAILKKYPDWLNDTVAEYKAKINATNEHLTH